MTKKGEQIYLFLGLSFCFWTLTYVWFLLNEKVLLSAAGVTCPSDCSLFLVSLVAEDSLG